MTVADDLFIAATSWDDCAGLLPLWAREQYGIGRAASAIGSLASVGTVTEAQAGALLLGLLRRLRGDHGSYRCYLADRQALSDLMRRSPDPAPDSPDGMLLGLLVDRIERYETVAWPSPAGGQHVA